MDNKNKKNMIILTSILILITLILLGLTYAYYRTRIVENKADKSISVTSEKLEVLYTDGTAALKTEGLIKPNFTATKEFFITNTGDKLSNYSVILDNMENTFQRKQDWIYTLTKTIFEVNEPIDYDNIDSGTIVKASEIVGNGNLSDSTQILLPNESIDISQTEGKSIVYKYILSIEYIDSVEDQSFDMGKSLSFRVNISNTGNLSEVLNDIQVGDIVNYTYLKDNETSRVYTTPLVSSNKSVNETTQAFDSGINGNVSANLWRVLSANEGGITLIADLPKTLTADNGLIISGSNGWINGETVLNEMCKTLYSGKYGSARSINAEDINAAVGYPTNAKTYKWYFGSTTSSTSRSYLAKDVTKTLKDLETDTLKIAGSRLTPDGSDIENVEADYYYYQLSAPLGCGAECSNNTIWNLLSGLKEDGTYKVQEPNLNNSIEGSPYWVASKTSEINFYSSVINYRMRFISQSGANTGNLNARWLYDSNGDQNEDQLIVRPVVTLYQNVELQKDPTNNIWNIID